jgi:hypothetical protein
MVHRSLHRNLITSIVSVKRGLSRLNLILSFSGRMPYRSAMPCPTRNPSGSRRKYMFSRSVSSSRSVIVGGLGSRKTVSVRGRGWAARRFARGTSSIRRRSIHVEERKEDNGSAEPTRAG